MLERKWLVYCHTHKETGKKYFGITSREVKDRWGNEGYGYQSSPYFYSAIKKYGWDNFYHIILHTNVSELDAKNFEKMYIALYKTNIKKYGYNCTAGGDGTVGNSFSEEARRKRGTDKAVVQMNMDGKYLNTYTNLHEAARQTNCNFSHISSCCNCRYKRESHKGFLWMFKEDYDKWDKILKTYYDRFEKEKTYHPKQKKIASKKEKGIKPINLFSDSGELLKTYRSMLDAQYDLNVTYDEIRKSCINKFKVKGYNFRFIDDEFEEIKEPIKNPKKGTPIVQYTSNGEFIRIYDRLKDVENDGFSKEIVGKCCLGKKGLYKNHIWQKYKGSTDNLNAEFVDRLCQYDENQKLLSLMKIKEGIDSRKRKINQYSLNGKYLCTFNSITEATNKYGRGISGCCSGKNKIAYGFIWEYADSISGTSDLTEE